MTFAQPYYDSDQSLTTAAGGPASLDEMKGKVVGVDTGSTGDMWATENSETYGFADIRRPEGLAPAMLDLAAGRIDGYISDIPALRYYVRDKPKLQVVQRIETSEKYSVMFAKDSELAGKLNDVLTTTKEEGVIAELHEKMVWQGAGRHYIDREGTAPAESHVAVRCQWPGQGAWSSACTGRTLQQYTRMSKSV